MTEPLTGEQLAEIRADLAAVPAPPWQWIGRRDTGPMLTTAHSGWLYLMGPSHPDAEDDEMRPVYADIKFRDQRDGQRHADLRPAAEMLVPRTDYDPDTYRDIDNPMARWIKRSAEHVTALLAEVDRLRARPTALPDDLADRYEAVATTAPPLYARHLRDLLRLLMETDAMREVLARDVTALRQQVERGADGRIAFLEDELRKRTDAFARAELAAQKAEAELEQATDHRRQT